MGTLLLCFVLTVSLFCTVIATATDNKETSNDFYTLSATDINGHEIHFEQYRGRVCRSILTIRLTSYNI